jgi:molybdenum cofactor biosynthesis MoaF-like protein
LRPPAGPRLPVARELAIAETTFEVKPETLKIGMSTMTSGFPGVGHRYFVDFVAFQVELDFASDTSLTYYNLDKDGNKVGSETVIIKVEPITDGIFLVTWQESDKTTVVHIEDYNRQTIVTNITESDLTFDQFHGTFRQLS